MSTCRDCFKTQCYQSERRNRNFHTKNLRNLNNALNTNFTKEDIELIYTKLGNYINQELATKFVKRKYDMKLLKGRSKQMSYDISLHNPVTKEVILFDEPHQMRGGTYVIGGTRSAELNITYNYSDYYYEAYEENGIREIYEKTGAESIPILENMIQRIKDKYGEECEKEGDSYWDNAPSNALKPLYQLIAMAKMRPDGVWDGD